MRDVFVKDTVSRPSSEIFFEHYITARLKNISELWQEVGLSI